MCVCVCECVCVVLKSGILTTSLLVSAKEFDLLAASTNMIFYPTSCNMYVRLLIMILWWLPLML